MALIDLKIALSMVAYCKGDSMAQGKKMHQKQWRIFFFLLPNQIISPASIFYQPVNVSKDCAYFIISGAGVIRSGVAFFAQQTRYANSYSRISINDGVIS